MILVVAVSSSKHEKHKTHGSITCFALDFHFYAKPPFVELSFNLHRISGAVVFTLHKKKKYVNSLTDIKVAPNAILFSQRERGDFA